MSISDQIAVMKEGVLQQTGRPQEVYDDPANLFTARFLGTPPINLFRGSIRNGALFIGTEAVLPAAGLSDQPVLAGIRPEGFLLHEQGPLSCGLENVEIMGRDISIVCSHPDCQTSPLRAIVSSESLSQLPSGTVRFALKPEKVLLFHPETEQRLRPRKEARNEQ